MCMYVYTYAFVCVCVFVCPHPLKQTDHVMSHLCCACTRGSTCVRACMYLQNVHTHTNECHDENNLRVYLKLCSHTYTNAHMEPISFLLYLPMELTYTHHACIDQNSSSLYVTLGLKYALECVYGSTYSHSIPP